MKQKSDRDTPLCIDLDGTLIHSDTMFESLVRLLGRNPFWIVPVLYWWTKGRAHLKAQLAAHVHVNPSTLPFNLELLEWVRAERAAGRRTLLVTASDLGMVEAVAAHIGVFDEVLASDGKRNLRGRNKGATLASLFGEKGFDYAGNSTVDLPVWERSRKAIVVNGSKALAAKAEGLTELGRVFPRQGGQVREFLRLLRVPDLISNLIVLAPALIGFVENAQPRFAHSVLACVAMVLCTAGGNALNELFRLDRDRETPIRRSRPFAAGTLEIQAGAVGGPTLGGLGLLLAGVVSPGLIVPAVLLLIIEALRRISEDGRGCGWSLCWAGLIAMRLIAGAIAI